MRYWQMTFLDRHHLWASCVSIGTYRSERWLVLGLAFALLAPGCSKEDPATSMPGVVQAPGTRETPKASAIFDLVGHRVNPFDAPGTKATVLIFVATECPISNRYAPEIRRLEQKFAPSGVRFWLVYADPEASPTAIGEHLKAYTLTAQVLRDPKHELVGLSRVHVTPEAAVFVPGPRLVYHGRIDDRYADLGKDRLEATQHDLERVVDAVVHGQPVPESVTRAIGCYISDAQ